MKKIEILAVILKKFIIDDFYYTINTNNTFGSNPNLKQIIKLGNNEQFNEYKDTKTLKIDI